MVMNHVMMILAGDGQEMTAKIYLAVIILGMMFPGFMTVMRFVWPAVIMVAGLPGKMTPVHTNLQLP